MTFCQDLCAGYQASIEMSPVDCQHGTPLSQYLNRLTDVKRSIYDVIEFESDTEKRFALALDAREDISLFFQAPTLVQNQDACQGFRKAAHNDFRPHAGTRRTGATAQRFRSTIGGKSKFVRGPERKTPPSC